MTRWLRSLTSVGVFGVLGVMAIGALCVAAESENETDSSVVVAAEEDPTIRSSIEAEFAAYQPDTSSAQPQPSTEPRRTTRRPTRGSQASSLRLASVPKMFGDVQFNGAQGAILIRDISVQNLTNFDLPLSGGARRLKIGENNSTLPDDRVVFLYNHFHNAIETSEGTFPALAPTAARSSSVDRYTVGIEKTYWDQMASVEVRMPFVSSFDFSPVNGRVVIDGGNTGNLAIISKYLLYAEDSWALGGGVAFDLPTGSDLTVHVDNDFFTINNDALHILPFLGLAMAPTDNCFFQSFAQLDFAANGNQITGTGLSGRDRLNDQNLLYLDIMGGVWLLRDTSAPVLTGLAAITELHYTSTIQDTDLVVIDSQQGQGSANFIAALANPFNRIDVLNLTAGLQAELGNTTDLRVAAVVPLQEEIDKRFFDAELQVQLNRRY